MILDIFLKSTVPPICHSCCLILSYESTFVRPWLPENLEFSGVRKMQDTSVRRDSLGVVALVLVWVGDCGVCVCFCLGSSLVCRVCVFW